MNIEISSMNSEELVRLFHQINSELTREFNNHASWTEQQERINQLTKISEELSKRKTNKANLSLSEIANCLMKQQA
jgi:hypothetical protein